MATSTITSFYFQFIIVRNLVVVVVVVVVKYNTYPNILIRRIGSISKFFNRANPECKIAAFSWNQCDCIITTRLTTEYEFGCGTLLSLQWNCNLWALWDCWLYFDRHLPLPYAHLPQTAIGRKRPTLIWSLTHGADMKFSTPFKIFCTLVVWYYYYSCILFQIWKFYHNYFFKKIWIESVYLRTMTNENSSKCQLKETGQPLNQANLNLSWH